MVAPADPGETEEPRHLCLPSQGAVQSEGLHTYCGVWDTCPECGPWMEGHFPVMSGKLLLFTCL